MRNLCYLHRTAGCELDKDRELLVGGEAARSGGGYIVRRLWAVVGSSSNRSGEWLCWIIMLGLNETTHSV